MFSKLSLFALVAPLVSALQIQVPTNPMSGSTVTIKWTNDAGDPSTFSIELVNTAFHNSFAIANNVVPSSGKMDIELPIVPVGSGYTLEAVNISDINQVFATSGSFSIADTSSSSLASSTSSGSSKSGSTSATATTTLATTPVATTSGFGTTVTSPHSSTTSSVSAPAQTTPTGAASPLRFSLSSNAGAFAVMFLSAVMGAAIVV